MKKFVVQKRNTTSVISLSAESVTLDNGHLVFWSKGEISGVVPPGIWESVKEDS